MHENRRERVARACFLGMKEGLFQFFNVREGSADFFSHSPVRCVNGIEGDEAELIKVNLPVCTEHAFFRANIDDSPTTMPSSLNFHKSAPSVTGNS